MKLDFEYGLGTMQAELPDNTDVFIAGETVKDPACIPEDQLETIQHSFEIQKTTGQDGIGLANLYNRLQILYEKPTNFKIASKEGAYTRITLVLPAAPDHSKDIFKRKE